MTQPPDDPSSAWVPPEQPAQEPPATNPPPSFQPPPPRPETNSLAVAALVTGLLGCASLFGLILGAIALLQIRRSGERGRGLAIGGIVAAAGWLLVLAVGFTTFTGDDDPEGPKVESLKAGDCFDGVAEGIQPENAKVVSCSLPHDAQIMMLVDIPVGGYPGREEIGRLAITGCGEKLQLPLAKSPFASRIRLSYLYPSKDAWENGHGSAIKCVAVGTKGKLTEAIDLASLRLGPGEKAWSQLRKGDCVKESPIGRESLLMTTVKCSTRHAAQVADRLILPAAPWPGPAGVTKQAEATCDKRVNSIFKKHPPDQDLRIAFHHPLQETWDSGDRTVVCYVLAAKGDLKKSVLP